MEKGVYGLLGYFPWFCEECDSRFLMRVRNNSEGPHLPAAQDSKSKTAKGGVP
jgi:hypothetical protein